jgi:prepilin-type N-terminal cleavage/methylation domain-containing protein
MTLSERGFTVLEMLVAMAILSLGAVALLNLAGENTRTAAALRTRHRSHSQRHATFRWRRKRR